MPRPIVRLTALVLATWALMLAGHSEGLAVAGTSTPNVSGTWQGTWSHEIGIGAAPAEGRQSSTGLLVSDDVRECGSAADGSRRRRDGGVLYRRRAGPAHRHRPDHRVDGKLHVAIADVGILLRGHGGADSAAPCTDL